MMLSVDASIKWWKGAAARLLAVTVTLVTPLISKAGWPQELAKPLIGEELSKQEKIYHSQGGDVLDGYITSRALSDYVALLPSGFCTTLASLSSSDRWLDIGGGRGDAILDYYGRTRCSQSGSKARGCDVDRGPTC